MIKLTTTQTVTIDDLGKRTFTHPLTDYVLTDEFTPETIRDSVDIQSAVTYGSIILTDLTGNTITDVANQPVIVIDTDVTLSDNSDLIVPSQKAIKTYSDTKVPNTRTINSKTLSSDIILDTSDISGTTDRRYVTDANLVVLGNTSGTNSGNETVNTIGTLINSASGKTTPADADMVGLMNSASSNVLNKLSWLNIKSTLKTYFDSLYIILTTKGDLYTYSTSAIKLSVGTNGQVLTPNSDEATGLKWVSPVFVQTTPTDPGTTSSTVGVMMGLKQSFTATKSGNVQIIISGDVDNASNSRGSQFQIRYGTGTAPNNGEALTGTVLGALQKFFQSNSGNRAPFSLNSGTTFTVGTTYWVDISLATITSGTSRVRDISVSIVEF
jgi:hypothetical protein